MAQPHHYFYVQTRIDPRTKAKATEALKAMGFSVSDAIRMLMQWVAEEKRLPFVVKVPNKTTQAAIAELEAGGGESADSVEAMMKALNTMAGGQHVENTAIQRHPAK